MKEKPRYLDRKRDEPVDVVVPRERAELIHAVVQGHVSSVLEEQLRAAKYPSADQSKIINKFATAIGEAEEREEINLSISHDELRYTMDMMRKKGNDYRKQGNKKEAGEIMKTHLYIFVDFRRAMDVPKNVIPFIRPQI